MNNEDNNQNLNPENEVSKTFSAQTLIQLLQQGELPEHTIRSIPAQQLYLAIREIGLTDSIDTLMLTSHEQCRLFLDFDIWQRDRIDESKIWEWLEVTDTNNNLEFLQKLLQCFDLKVITALLSKYVQCVQYEEATEAPPDTGFITPDKGKTWICVNIEDELQRFLLSRLLALIFETDAALYYQLLNIASTSTESYLEEEAFTDRQKRLEAEGVPGLEFIEQLHTPILPAELEKILSGTTVKNRTEHEPATERTTSTLDQVLANLHNQEEAHGELALLVNAALIHYHRDFANRNQLQEMLQFVKATIQVGLDAAITIRKVSPEEIYQQIGFQKLYRLGLFHLQRARKEALQFTETELRKLADQKMDFFIIAGLRDNPPSLPEYQDTDNLEEDIQFSPISSLAVLEKMIERISQLRKRS